MDVDSIAPGVDFAAAIDEAVASCAVLLVLIGPNWVDARDEHGRRRLDDAEDFVVLEIAAALQRNVWVLPVLVDGVSPPRRNDLPEALMPLVRRNAVRLDQETFRSDAKALLDAVAKIVESRLIASKDADRARTPETRTFVAEGADHVGRPRESVPTELLATLLDPDPEVRARAVRKAAELGDPAAVGLLAALLDTDLGRRRWRH